MSMKKQHFSLLLWATLYLTLATWFWFAYHSLTLGEAWAAWLYPEDHFFENLGAISLFLAAGLASFAFMRGARTGGLPLRTCLYLLLSISFLIGAGQEIGWGQRWLQLSGPGLPASASEQPEPAHTPVSREADPLLHPDNILNLLLVALSAGLPLAWLVFPGLRLAARDQFPAALLGIGPLFLLNQALAIYARENFKPWYRFKIVRFPQAIQEIKESNLEVLCAILALIALWELGYYLKHRQAL